MDSRPSPKVSVVMSVYNGARFLREALRSILGQTFTDFEFIIIDDGSTDATPKILKEFDDPRIKIIVNAKNEGLTRSLIKGCNVARGKYIARMDADDVSDPRRLGKQVEFLDKHPDHAAVGCSCYYIGHNGKPRSIEPYCPDNESSQDTKMLYSPFCHGATMLVKDSVRRCGGYREAFRAAQDYDLWLRLSEKYKLANLQEPLYSLRMHGATVSAGNQFVQSRFGDLARRMAEMRARDGADLLMKNENELLQEMVSSFYPSPFWKHWNEKTKSLVFVGAELFHRKFHSMAARYLIKAFLRNPAEKTLWQFLISRKVRARVAEAIRRRTSLRNAFERDKSRVAKSA